jgi:phenylacetate-CoA ligase
MIKKCIWSILSAIKDSNFDEEYKEIKDVRIDNLVKIQTIYLEKILKHAYMNVPYYRKTFNEIGLMGNGDILDKLNQIPTLTKKTIRENFNLLKSKDIFSRIWFYNSTGGSTGEPLKLIQDNQYTKWRNAANYYYYANILDIDEPHVKKVIIWGSTRDLIKGTIGLKAKISNWLTNTILLNSFRMTNTDMERFLDIINKYQPDMIRGYTGSLYELSKYIMRKNKSIHRPKVLISAAETLTDEMRTVIEEAFKTKLYNFYGSREVSSIAGECKNGLMHLLMFWNYVEILDENNQPVSEGEEGRVVITNLHNYSMPLIRYEIGDMAILAPQSCSCGSPLPTLIEVTGRLTDHFITGEGTTIPAEFFIHLIGVIHNNGSIDKFQVIQEDYKKIKILVVVKNNKEEIHRKDIEEKTRLVMGLDCQIIWDFVYDIPKTQTGKYLYTKSLVRR